MPQRTEPPAATAPSAPAPAPSAPPPAEAAATPAEPAKLVATVNPLRKQTLLGIAPVIPAQAGAPEEAPKTEAAAQAPSEAPGAEAAGQATTVDAPSVEATKPAAAPAVEAPSVSSVVTPAAVATDAPTTTDVEDAPVAAAKKPRSEPARVAPAALTSSHDDLPQLKAQRPRWVLPLGIAAVLGLGVVGLRKLDRAPAPLPAELGQPVTAKKKAADAKAAAAATPKSEDDDDGDGPNTGTDAPPDTRPTEPVPLADTAKAQPAEDPKAKASEGAKGAPAEDVKPAAAAAAASATADAGSIIRINIESDPPGARMFWKGKEQGTTPFVLEFRAGERHAYELGLPGYTTRKVVIDGSKTEISIGLRPDPGAPAGARPRK
ncbi:MAG TPA: hypothetical protein VHP33_40030 [Polyangiaceae bacterium]|nr:hypothetical protein [Polyangiaceae bacterium]